MTNSLTSRSLMIAYLSTLAIALLVVQRSKFTAIWQVILSIFVWIIVVEVANVYLGFSSLSSSNVFKVTGLSFVLEFIVTLILSKSLVKVWMLC